MNKNIKNRVSLSLDSYLVEVNKHPLQTVEEQTELVHRIKEGDEEALAQLISGNLVKTEQTVTAKTAMLLQI